MDKLKYINNISDAKNQIKKIISDSYNKCVENGELILCELNNFAIETPKDKSHGEFAVNFALVNSKLLKDNPRSIGKKIYKNINLENTYFEKCEIAGPGFINFFIGSKWFEEVIKTIFDQKDNFGKSDIGNNQKVMVEFVSANPTGPMHIGNARGGALGDCLSSVLSMAGYDVTREFYVNDAGNQIEKFYQSLKARYFQHFNGEESYPFPEDGYHGADIIERAKQFAEEFGDKYLTLSDEELRDAIIPFALERNIKGLQDDLARYRINYDVWFRESKLYEDGELDETIKILKDKGCLYEKDGAIYYKATDFGGEKDEVLIRSNGVPTYFAADIAYHRNKFQMRGFDKVINIWGADHHGHVARLKGAMDAIGLDGNKLDIVLMQLVRLTSNGEIVKVSKRTGKSISLSNLLDDISVDAARYFFNTRESNTHLEFDMALAMEKSSENPVFYVQYAHARICSIEKNLKEDGISLCDYKDIDLCVLDKDEERDLIKLLATMPDEIIASADSYDPSRMTKYVYNVAAAFHKFYNACRIKGEEENLLKARLALALATRQVIKNVLSMLNIDAPESM